MCFLILSCDSTLPVETESFSEPEDREETLSVCYNNDSPQHGQICSEQCFENYTDTEFCWTLERDDCIVPFQYEWQEKNCHLFD